MKQIIVMIALAIVGLASAAQAEECPAKCPEGQRRARWCKCSEGCTVANQICRCVDNGEYLKNKIVQQVAAAEAEKVRLTGDIAKLTSERDISRAEVSRLLIRIGELDAEVARLKGLVANDTGLLARVTELDEDVVRLKAEVERLTAENGKLREENAELKGPRPLQLSLEYMTALRVVDPPANCATCRQRKSFPMAGTLALKYEFHLGNGVVGIAPGLLGRIGGDDEGEPFGGGGFLLELNVFPEKQRIFKIGIDVAGVGEVNAKEAAFNFEVGFGLGAMWAPGIGFTAGIRYSLHALNDQRNVPWAFLQFVVGIPTGNKKNH